MKREFIYFKTFEKHWRELGLTDNELIFLENLLMDNPNTGDVIQGTGGLRKMRLALPHKGKSGGARVLYVDFVSHEKTILMAVYAKNEQENISDVQKQQYKKLILALSKELEK